MIFFFNLNLRCQVNLIVSCVTSNFHDSVIFIILFLFIYLYLRTKHCAISKGIIETAVSLAKKKKLLKGCLSLLLFLIFQDRLTFVHNTYCFNPLKISYLKIIFASIHRLLYIIIYLYL